MKKLRGASGLVVLIALNCSGRIASASVKLDGCTFVDQAGSHKVEWENDGHDGFSVQFKSSRYQIDVGLPTTITRIYLSVQDKQIGSRIHSSTAFSPNAFEGMQYNFGDKSQLDFVSIDCR